MRIGLLCTVLAACRFDAGENLFQCESNGSCPEHHSCIDQLCVPDPPVCTAAVGAKAEHTCTIRSDGTAWCWGRNDKGQLGDGTTTDHTSPVAIKDSGFPRFTAVTGGKQHACALGKDGTVWCWGLNDLGQLGVGVPASGTPVKVVGVMNATAIATGDAHTCALGADHRVTCWGDNASGQLGRASPMSSATPTTVESIPGAKLIAAGDATTCAVDDNDAWLCWGASDAGQLCGPPSPQPHPAIVKVSDQQVIGIAVRAKLSCALTAGHDVLCMGLYFAWSARSAADDLRRLKRDGVLHTFSEARPVEDRGQRDTLLTNIGLGVTGACAIATGVMYWRRPREHAETRITAVPLRAGGWRSLPVRFDARRTVRTVLAPAAAHSRVAVAAGGPMSPGGSR